MDAIIVVKMVMTDVVEPEELMESGETFEECVRHHLPSYMVSDGLYEVISIEEAPDAS